MIEATKHINLKKQVQISPITSKNLKTDFISACKGYPIGGTKKLIKIIGAFNDKYINEYQMAIFPVYKGNFAKQMLKNIESELGDKRYMIQDHIFLGTYNSQIQKSVLMRLPDKVANGASENYLALQLRIQPLPVPEHHEYNPREMVSSLALVALILAAKEKGDDRVQYYLFPDSERSRENLEKIRRDLKL